MGNQERRDPVTEEEQVAVQQDQEAEVSESVESQAPSLVSDVQAESDTQAVQSETVQSDSDSESAVQEASAQSTDSNQTVSGTPTIIPPPSQPVVNSTPKESSPTPVTSPSSELGAKSGTDQAVNTPSPTLNKEPTHVHPAAPIPRDPKTIRESGSILDTDIDDQTRKRFIEYQSINQIHTTIPGKTVKEITISTLLPEYSFVAAQEDKVLKKKPVAQIVAMDWQLSREPFEGELPPRKGVIVAQSLRDTENIQSMKFTVEIGKEEILYGRYRKYQKSVNPLTNEEIVIKNKWSIWNKVDGSQNGIQLSDTVVRTPLISVETDFQTSEKGELVISGTPFAMFNGPGKHQSSSWRVKTLDGVYLFNRERDEDHLENIRLPYDIFKGNQGFEVSLRYHTDLNGQSNWARSVFVNFHGDTDMFNATLDFGIVIGKKAYISIHAYTDLFNYADVEIRDEDDQVVQSLKKVTNRQIIMPTTNLKENMIYKVYVRAVMIDGTMTKWKMVKETMAVPNNFYNYKKDMSYLNKIVFGQEIIMGGSVILSTTQRYMGDILLVKHDSQTLNSYVFAGGKLLDQGVVYTFKESVTLPYINVIQLPNDDVILNYTTEDQDRYLSSIFVYLKYNHFRKNYKEVSKTIRPYEKFSTGISNSVAVDPRVDHPYLHYIPAREVDGNGNEANLNMYKLDYSDPKNMRFERICPLPFEAKRNVSLAYTHDHKMVVFGGTDASMVSEKKRDGSLFKYWKRINNAIYIFDPETKEFDTLCLMPKNYNSRIYNSQAFLRRDDKIIAFNSSNTSTEDSKRFLVIDYKNKTAETFKSEINDRIPFRVSIQLNNGDVLRISSSDHDPQKLFRYAAISTDENAVYDDEHAKRSEKVLIVKSKDTVAIEDPSIYDTIIISGNNRENTGILRIVSDDKLYEYDYSYKIVTRDTAMSSAEFARWDSLYTFVLWGCELSIDNSKNADEEFVPVGLKPTKEEVRETIVSMVQNMKKQGMSFVTENNYFIKITPKEINEENIAAGTTDLKLSVTELLTGQKLIIEGVMDSEGVITNKHNGDIIFPTRENDQIMYYEVYSDDSPITVIQNAIMLLNKKPESKDIVAAVVTSDQVDMHELKLILSGLLLDPRKLINENIVNNLKAIVRTLGGEYLKMTD